MHLRIAKQLNNPAGAVAISDSEEFRLAVKPPPSGKKNVPKWQALKKAAPATQPKITLCMIVRDEADYLDDCLKSAKGVVNDIVIVDTGSTDHTIEIAEAHGANVHNYAWTDNYSDARNEALKHATGDWVLALDADEQLDGNAREIILRAVSRPIAEAYELEFHNYYTESAKPQIQVNRACRLFRNKPNYRYTGRVHERIMPSINAAGGSYASLSAVVHHYGYKPTVMEERGKLERYIRLLQADLMDMPGDPDVLYNLGNAYWASADYENTRAYCEQAIKVIPVDGQYAVDMFTGLATALISLGRPNDALVEVKRAEAQGIVHPHISFCKGSAYLALEQHQDAISEFEAAIRQGQKGVSCGDTAVSGYKSYCSIAKAYTALGKHKKAIEFCEKALREMPDDANSHSLLAQAFKHTNQPQKAEKHFLTLRLLRPDDHRALKDLADLYQGQERHEEATTRYDELLQAGQETAELHAAVAESLQALGKLDIAENHLLRAIELTPNNAQAHTSLGRLYAAQERAADALQLFARAVEVEPAYANAYFNAGDLLYRVAQYADAANVYQNGLVQDPLNASGFFTLGNCYFQLGAYEAAAMSYRQALAIRPNYTEALNNLSFAEQSAVGIAANKESAQAA